MMKDLYDKQGFKIYELNRDQVMDNPDILSCIEILKTIYDQPPEESSLSNKRALDLKNLNNED